MSVQSLPAPQQKVAKKKRSQIKARERQWGITVEGELEKMKNRPMILIGG